MLEKEIGRDWANEVFGSEEKPVADSISRVTVTMDDGSIIYSLSDKKLAHGVMNMFLGVKSTATGSYPYPFRAMVIHTWNDRYKLFVPISGEVNRQIESEFVTFNDILRCPKLVEVHFYAFRSFIDIARWVTDKEHL